MICAEQNLWSEVLHLTVQDAMEGSTGGHDRRAKIKQTYGARAYLTTPNEDLNIVCTLADLDPVAVREAMIKRIAEAPTPEELVNSTRKRRGNREGELITHNGQTLSATAWADQIGISGTLFSQRLKKGWSMADIMTPPWVRPDRRGVVSNFRGDPGTGGGTAAQETQNITFQDAKT